MRITLLFMLLMTLAAESAAVADARDETLFELKVRPILAQHCLECHGAEKAQNDLRLDSRDALLRGGKSGAAIVPGRSDESLLIQAIRRANDDLQMPPDDPLSESAIGDLAAWIDAGAPWPAAYSKAGSMTAARHWAFEPVADTAIPVEIGPQETRPRSPTDAFLAARQRERGVTAVGMADRRTLLRRASIDLCGIPPTIEEIEDFINDSSPTAWERCIDRLLASPRYGERWGRHWMDVVRYADTAGDNADYPIPEAHRYRDYIVESFDADVPYDVFLKEQIAGDLLPSSSSDQRARQIVATGFLALSRRYATAPYELWHLTIEDTIDSVGSAVMGLTLRCARCHDHKFDPITSRDYYGLYGIFASTRFPYTGSEEFSSKSLNRQHLVPLVEPQELARSQDAHGKRLEELRSQIQVMEKKSDKEEKKRIKEMKTALRAMEGAGGPTDLAWAYSVSESTPCDVAIQLQGDPAKAGEVVPRGAIQFLPSHPVPTIPSTASGRLELAEWLAHSDHPLTARVMVNRVWQHHFGRGLVETPSDFGRRGGKATHPDLLNWLAREFVLSGWAIKQMHHELMESEAYQRTSMSDPSSATRDPENVTWWRGQRRRLDAESLRDSILFLGGHLDLSRPGPHAFPPIEKWHWTQHNPFRDVYPTRHRSVYLMTQRLVRHPFLSRFDFPDTNQSTAIRTSSTVPLQALYLLNNPQMMEEADGFAREVEGISSQTRERVERACEMAWSRRPTPDESDRMEQFVDTCANELRSVGHPTDSIDHAALACLTKVILMSNEFLYVD